MAGTATANQGHDRPVSAFLIPVVHRLAEFSAGFPGRGQLAANRRQLEIALLDVLGLGRLEIVQRPEQRQQSLVCGQIEAELMGGIDHKDTVELESRRLGADVADTRQKQRRQQLAIGDPLLDLLGQHAHALVTRRSLDQLHQWLDAGVQLDQARRDLDLVIGQGRQAGRSQQATGSGSQEFTSSCHHGLSLVIGQRPQDGIVSTRVQVANHTDTIALARNRSTRVPSTGKLRDQP